MAINLYEVHARQSREAAHAEYIADAGFPELVQRASALGFRKASISEINSSAESAHGALDLYSWRGGLWVKTAT